MKLLKAILASGVLASLASCASMNPPEGGPRDLVPPVLLSSNPQDQQLNVSTNSITLEFDEEVQQNNLNKELLITPSVENRYKILPNKNQLTLEFEKPLEENTTYTLNFREGIVDITEKNKAKNLKLAFSTGSFIDSSRVSGTVVNLMKQTPEKGAVVALYRAEDTLSIRKNRPYYLTTTDDAGNFEIENVKEGNYRVYGLVDKNNNMYYDSEEERIAYLPQPLRITPDTEPVKLQTVRIDTKKPILLRRETYSDRFIANYNEGIQSFSVKPLESTADSTVSEIILEGKAAQLFKTPKFEGGKTVLTAVDSAGNIAIDTLQIAFQGKRAQLIKGAQLKVINGKSGKYRPGQPVVVELQTPVKITGEAPLMLMADTTVLTQLTYPNDISLSKANTELRFNLPSVNNRVKQVTLLIDSTAVVPMEGEPLSYPKLNIGISEEKGAGSFRGIVKTEYSSYIVQLLNSNFKVVDQVRNQRNFQFKNLEPGAYTIRVLIDEDNDGEWEKADPAFERAPEKVYVFPKAIDARANWEIEEILEF
ncbi:polysaccharide lyase family 4-like protein [Pontibacter ummariensis]|uniref:Polysaccharide lyase family 4, domain II n=1 Tax=Pontibacter ummariensis TaxID=1610492 RepID=A0A239CHZ3_9BACT|nr:Ig-like domain-containing domain [Pontibacter ummariensis]PRY15000.1 polysaccharide lyase family 4-like protein [Pontibacter ummariensis]SNS19797.1 Polysaccharide lyase family 4, domain II [Pontibacter ummariensis]